MSPIHNPSSSNNTTPTLSKKAMRKVCHQSLEGLLKHNLDMCSRHDDLVEALHLYNEAQRDGVNLALHHYNVLLYLCTLDGERGSNLHKGFEIFQPMVIDKVMPNEVTFTKWITISPNC
ncbi:proteinaceous RNase P 1, chloroplastic/mitochondrial-like isoform X3 [Fagus crenata]